MAAAAALAAWCATIDNNPILRTGQVSALAAVQLRVALSTLVVLVLVGIATSRGRRDVRRLAVRLGSAVIAGLSTGLLAGGQLFLLRDTPWPLNSNHGDNGMLIVMAREVIATGSTHSFYPPAVPYVMAFLTDHLGLGNPGTALKPINIWLLVLTGPGVYLAWRLTTGPLAALALMMASVLPQVTPYKAYSPLVLALLLPLLVALLQWLRTSERRPVRANVISGLAFGATLGGLFLVYSGWHVWMAPGAAVAVMFTFPWRRGRVAMVRAGALLTSTGLAFLLVAGRYLLVLLGATSTKDTYCSPITLSDPAYIGPNPYSGLFWDQAGEWPPFGWFAGLDVFTLALLAGAAVSLTLGFRRPVVHGTLAIFAGAWLSRFWIVHNLERDQATQLFPRTTNVIQVCLCVLFVVAVLLVVERGRGVLVAVRNAAPNQFPSAAATSHAAVAALAFAALTFGMAGSAITNQYLPERPELKTGGTLAWYAHNTRTPEGPCPTFAEAGQCTTPAPPGPLPASADYATSETTPTFLQDCEYPWRKADAGAAR